MRLKDTSAYSKLPLLAPGGSFLTKSVTCGEKKRYYGGKDREGVF